jgi:hypothetical protein
MVRQPMDPNAAVDEFILVARWRIDVELVAAPRQSVCDQPRIVTDSAMTGRILSSYQVPDQIRFRISRRLITV